MPELGCPQCASPCDEAHRFCPICGFPVGEVARNQSDPLLGTTLPGGYVILELVGVGGMGRVYRAEQKALGRTVAVKIIHPHLLGDESASARFITEARATSRLNHPNSVAVIDFGKNGNQLYLVMEFLRGRDLARVVYEDGPLSMRRIVEVMCQVLAALGEAHHLDIIHRDLKPENIVLERMRTGADFVKVVDFGLAKMKAGVTSTGITNPGIVCGTPDYMAPEQGRGDPIDSRSDLYACGVILFQLLGGRLPFEAESPTQVVLMHMQTTPPDLSELAPERGIPKALIDVTARSLEKNADDRYQSAEEFAEALRATLVSLDIAAPSHADSAARALDGVVCASCRSTVPRGQRFCGDCGARVQHASVPPPALPEPMRERSLPRLPLPLTGREEDIEWLEACRLEVDNSVTAVLLAGEPGVGKTRLLAELVSRARAQHDVVVETSPDPWGAEVGYSALRKAIVALAGLPPDGGLPSHWVTATPEAKRGLAEIFGKATRMPESSSDVWTRPTPGGITAEDRRFMASEALRWAVVRAHAPEHARLLLTIDDLHAVDGASRHAFGDVVSEPPLASMLIVATHVPGFDAGWKCASKRVLFGLSADVAAALAKGVSSRKRADVGSRRVVPLYVDQLVRFNMEGGSDPPSRLADLVAMRIERLPPDARRTLQALAVLGDATDRAMLGALVPEVRDIEPSISTLKLMGMAAETEAGLRTSHPLLRDVTLATIPAAVRRDLHAKAGEAGEASLPLEALALHAFHAQNAFEALMLLERVADRAKTRADLPGTILALRRGLDLARREMFRGELDDPIQAVLIFSRKLGDALARAGNLTDADGVLREALDLAGPAGAHRAKVLGSLAFVARERSRLQEASSFLREALDLARQAAASDLVSSLERMHREWAG